MGRIIKVTATTGKPIVEYVCEDADEVLEMPYDGWECGSRCKIYTVSEGESTSYSISEYELSPSGIWFPLTEGAEDINPSENS